MRKLLLLSLVLAPLLAAAQDLTKPVDYTTRAKPTSVVLAELSKKTGVEFICTPDLDDEPLILRFEKVPLKDAMDKIAYVFAGEWKKIDKQYRLERGKEADDLHTAMIKGYADDFKQGVQEAAKTFRSATPYTIETAKGQMEDVKQDLAHQGQGNTRWENLWQRTPASRLLLRILQKMDPMVVADMPRNRPLVFSNAPTGLQHLLSMDLNADFDQYEKEQGLLNSEIDQAIAQHSGQAGWLPSGLRPRSRESVARVVVSVGGVRGLYSASMYVMDSSERVIANGRVDINWNSAYKANWLKQGELMRTQKITAPLGATALDILANIDNVENFRYVRPNTRAVLLSPSQTDPLAVATSDIILGLAENDHVNVAFLPPDDSDNWCYRIGKSGKISLRAYQEAAAFSKELEVIEEKGWLVGAPTDPLETTRERLSRPALEEIANYIDKTRKVGIDARARFECDARPDSNKVLVNDAFMALFNWPYQNDEMGDEGCLALFGTLSDRDRQIASDDVLRIRAVDLSEQQVSYLHQWLMRGDHRFAIKDKSFHLSGEEKTFYELGEPTEVLGGGLPDSAYLEVIDRLKPMYSMRREAGGKFSYGCDVEGLGILSAKIERPDLYPEVTARSTDFISIGTERDVVVRFCVGDQFQEETFSEEESPSRSEPSINLAQLLQQMTAEQKLTYTQSLEKWRARFLNKKPLNLPGTPPLR